MTSLVVLIGYVTLPHGIEIFKEQIQSIKDAKTITTSNQVGAILLQEWMHYHMNRGRQCKEQRNTMTRDDRVKFNARFSNLTLIKLVKMKYNR